ARGKKGNQTHQQVSFADQPAQSAFLQSIAAQKFSRIRIAHLGKFCFYLAANSRGPSIRARSELSNFVLLYRLLQLFTKLHALANVEHIKNWLFAEEHESAKAFLVFGRHLQLAQRLL